MYFVFHLVVFSFLYSLCQSVQALNIRVKQRIANPQLGATAEVFCWKELARCYQERLTLVSNFKILALTWNFFGTVSLSGLLIERVVGEYGAADAGTSREGVAPMQGLVLWAAFSQAVAAGLTSLAPLVRGAGEIFD
jgi:hypothetical protein